MSEDVPTLEAFRNSVDALPKNRNTTIIKTLYLTATRCNEILTKISPADKKHTQAKGELGTFTLETMPISSLNNALKRVLLMKIPVLKRRTRKMQEKNKIQIYKMIGLPIDNDYESWTIDLLRWISSHNSLSFDLTRQSVYKIVKKTLGIRPHLLRHYRLTHLMINYGFTASDLTQYAGWSLRTGYGAIGQMVSPNVNTYLHLQWTQYINKLFIPYKNLTIVPSLI